MNQGNPKRMRIEFLTQDDPLYILPFFDEFFSAFGGEFEVAGISCCRTMGKRSRRNLAEVLWALYGPLGLTRLAARSLWMRVQGWLSDGRRTGPFHSIRQLAHGLGIPFRAVGDPNDQDYVSGLRSRDVDLLVSVACPYRLKEELLHLPAKGCINIHHARLPRYKGMMPTFWQLYHGEKSVGLTVHFMGAELDEGGVLLQEELEVRPREALDTLIRRTKRHGAHCMAQVLRQLEAGPVSLIDLNGAKPSYFTFPTPAEAREFRRRGYRAI